MSTIEQRLSKALSAETSAFLGREVSTQHDDRERDNSIYVHGVSAIAPLGDGRTFRALARAFKSGGWVEVEVLAAPPANEWDAGKAYVRPVREFEMFNGTSMSAISAATCKALKRLSR